MQAINHYKQNELIISNLSDALARIKEVGDYATNRALQVFWRGQSDYTWGLTSLLARQLSAIAPTNDPLLDEIEDRILKEGGDSITDLTQPAYNNPLARLAYMQHHGIPTRLIDFTKDAWMAMFFAVETGDSVDGRLFAILVDGPSVLSSSPKGTPWRSYKTSEVKIWDPVASGVKFPRILAQNGVFAVGRLPSTQPHRTGFDELLGTNRSLLAEEIRRIFSIPFKLVTADPIPPNASPPIGLTYRVHIDKETVRRDLMGARHGRRISPSNSKITHKHAYPDADGMRMNSELLRGLDRGVIISRR
jgi:hypothetical protein